MSLSNEQLAKKEDEKRANEEKDRLNIPTEERSTHLHATLHPSVIQNLDAGHHQSLVSTTSGKKSTTTQNPNFGPTIRRGSVKDPRNPEELASRDIA